MDYLLDRRCDILTVLYRKFVGLLFAVLFLFPTVLMTSHVSALSSSDSTTYQTYQNTSYGFSIQYPSDWHIVEHVSSQYAIKSALLYPDSNLQINAGILQGNNPYNGKSSADILGQIKNTMQAGCTNANLQNRGFTCSNSQFFPNVTNYRGTTAYGVTMTWDKTSSSGQSLPWISTWMLIPHSNDVWVLIIEGSQAELIQNSQIVSAISDSFDIADVKQMPPAISNVANTSTAHIPTWIKNIAKLWSNSSIGDSDFVNSIQYLIQSGIISISSTHANPNSQKTIPSWVKNNAKYWSEGQIGDSDFLNGIKYMVENGIISAPISSQQNMTGILSGATAFPTNGTAPQMIEYTDKDGVTLTVQAIPNQVLLYVYANSNDDDISSLVADNSGKILSSIPLTGYYLVQVNDVKNFISSALQKSFVIDAHPNFILSTNLFGATSPTIINSISDPAKNPNPNAHVIMAIIDDFRGGCNGYVALPHGCQVINEIQSKNSDISILALQVPPTTVKDEKGNVQEVFTSNDINWNIMRAVATAQENNQKLVINLSMSQGLRDANGQVVDQADEKYYNSINTRLESLANLDWVQKNNVLFYQSAGNDNVDLSNAVQKLETKSDQSALYKNIFTLVGQTDPSTNQPKKYTNDNTLGSNYGTGIIYDSSTASCCPLGTSFTAPNLAVGAAAIWANNQNLSQSDIHSAIVDSAKQNSKNGNPTFDPQNAYNVANKCLPVCGQIDYGTGSNWSLNPANIAVNVAQNQNSRPALTSVLTSQVNVTGKWGGYFTMHDTTSDGCTFNGQWQADFVQTGNNLKGVLSITSASSPDYPSNDFCTWNAPDFPFAGTISGTLFQVTGPNSFTAQGSFTSDSIRITKFTECSDESCATGTMGGTPIQIQKFWSKN